MTPAAVLAAVALRAAVAHCPALATQPPTLVVHRIAECAGWRTGMVVAGRTAHVRGCFTLTTNRIEIDPTTTPRRDLAGVVGVEARRACLAARGGVWWFDTPAEAWARWVAS